MLCGPFLFVSTHAALGGGYGEEAVGHVAQPTEGSAGSCSKLVEDRMMRCPAAS